MDTKTTFEAADKMQREMTFLIIYLLEHRPTEETLKYIIPCQKAREEYMRLRA